MEQESWNDEAWRGAWDPFIRLSYQFGMMLGVDEFQQEQGYHVTKHRLSQRLFVGMGLVWGAKVEVKVSEDAETLTVQPLFALDELGRELWTKEPCTLDLKRWAEQNELPDNTPVYLVVGYHACGVSPMPAVAAPCDDSSSPTMASRALELAKVELLLDAPPAPIDISDAPSTTPGDTQSVRFATLVDLIRCDGPRPLLLGTLRRTPDDSCGRHTWTFDRGSRPLVPMVGGAPFRVVSAFADGATRKLTVVFTEKPLYASTSAFRVDELVSPYAPIDLVDAEKAPCVSGDGRTLELALTAGLRPGTVYRVSVAGAGPAALIVNHPLGLMPLNQGKDFVRYFKTPAY